MPLHCHSIMARSSSHLLVCTLPYAFLPLLAVLVSKFFKTQESSREVGSLLPNLAIDLTIKYYGPRWIGSWVTIRGSLLIQHSRKSVGMFCQRSNDSIRCPVWNLPVGITLYDSCYTKNPILGADT